MDTILEKLKQINKIPLHMPGHKRNTNAFSYLSGLADIDITEIDGFDNLHNSEGILKASMEMSAKIRGAKRAFYLVNGSTCGLLAAICSVVKEGDKVIVARNCHKSVYNGIELSKAEPVFVYPTLIDGIFGSVEPEKIQLAIDQNSDAKLIILTSPTYEGVISDVKGICEVAHKKGIPVLIDAAHGAHLGFSEFSQDATALGADICVESLHKTLPSLTQTAICYLSGDLADDEMLAEKLSVFETSSPSYILLSSIDGCMNFIKNNAQVFDDWHNNLESFYKKSKNLKGLKLLSNENKKFFDFDKSKLVILTGNKNGPEFAKMLRNGGFEPELVSNDYVILMTGLGDGKEIYDKLFEFLLSVDKEFSDRKKETVSYDIITKSVMPIKKAKESNLVLFDIFDSAGKVSGGYVWAYPPGVPVLIPGEAITKDVISYMEYCKKNGVSLYGSIENDKILVIK